MTAIFLLADAAKQAPVLATVPWKVNSTTAEAALYYDGAPDALKLIGELHAIGWKRNGQTCMPGTWTVTAELARDGATLRIEGMTSEPPANGRSAIPYFASLPPKLRRGEKALAEYREWERKCFEQEW